MSRETNSTLLRYSINTFWSNSISSDRALYSKKQYEYFFILLLRNYFLQSLKIQYKSSLINIYVYFYKDDKLSFIQKYITWKKIQLNTLLYRKNYNILNKKKIQTYTKKNLILKHLFSLLYKLKISKYIYNFLKREQKQKNDIFFINPSKTNYTQNILCNKKFFFYKKLKLKKINNVLKFKWLGLLFSNILYFYTNNKNSVILKPSLDKLTYTKMPFFFKYLKYDISKKKLYILLTGLSFFKSFILNLYISDIIKSTKNKKHIKNLISFFSLIKTLFNKQIIPFSGFKFFISGRLNGKLRKGSFGFKLGIIKLMTLDTFVNYSCDIVYTQYGSFCLKSWLCESSIEYNEKKNI